MHSPARSAGAGSSCGAARAKAPPRPRAAEAMQVRQLAILEAMGVDAYVRRSHAAASTPAVVPREPESPDWDSLAAIVRDCRLCGLCETRTQTVFGIGNRA